MLLFQVGKQPFRPENHNLTLATKGAKCEYAASADVALEFLELYSFDTDLVDLDQPSVSGLNLIRRIGAARLRSPIIASTAAKESTTRIEALDNGADDVLTWPWSLEEQFARLRAIARRENGYVSSTLHSGGLELHLGSREVRAGGEPLCLTPKEYALLELLMLKRGYSVRKETCLNHLYGAADVPDPKTIDVIVCRLRKKLAAVGLAHMVQSVWGHGFKLADPALTRVPALLASRVLQPAYAERASSNVRKSHQAMGAVRPATDRGTGRGYRCVLGAPLSLNWLDGIVSLPRSAEPGSQANGACSDDDASRSAGSVGFGGGQPRVPGGRADRRSARRCETRGERQPACPRPQDVGEVRCAGRHLMDAKLEQHVRPRIGPNKRTSYHHREALEIEHRSS